MDSSCTGPGGCFPFDMCDLNAQNLYLSYSGGAKLFVGTTTGSGYLQVGNTGASMHQAYFGRRVGAGAYKMAVFQAYATSTILEAENFLQLGSQQDFNLAATTGQGTVSTGTSFTMTAGTSITMSSLANFLLSQQSSLHKFALDSVGSLELVGGTFTSVTGSLIIGTRSLTTPGQRWFATNPDYSIVCAAPPAANDTSRDSFWLYQDLIMAAQHPNSTFATGGAKILTQNANGFLIVGPYLEVCGGIIRSSGTALTLQDDSATDTLDVRATITNADPTGGGINPVRFSDVDGADFKDTFIYNSGINAPALGRAYIKDENGFLVDAPNTTLTGELIVGGDTDITGTLTVNGTGPHTIIGPTVVTGTFGVTGLSTFTGNMLITGDLQVTGTINGGTAVTSPSCCTSDARAKTAVKNVDTSKALDRLVNKMHVKEFRYTPEYQASDRNVKNATYFGVIAQEVKDDFDYMVDTVKRKVGQVVHHDFHVIRPELLYGEIVGAVQHIHKMHTDLKARVESLEKQAMEKFGPVREKLSTFENMAAQKVYDASAKVSELELAAEERLVELKTAAKARLSQMKRGANKGTSIVHDMYARLARLEARMFTTATKAKTEK